MTFPSHLAKLLIGKQAKPLSEDYHLAYRDGDGNSLPDASEWRPNSATDNTNKNPTARSATSTQKKPPMSSTAKTLKQSHSP